MDNDKLIEKHTGLVKYVAKRYLNNGLDFEDLCQEGYIGLLTANSKYIENNKCKFSTYAYQWIKQSIIRAIENTGSLVRIPSYKHKLCDSRCADFVDNLHHNNSDSNITVQLLLDKIKIILGDSVDYEIYIDRNMNDLSYRAIGDKHGLSYEAIRKRLIILQQLVKDKLNK